MIRWIPRRSFERSGDYLVALAGTNNAEAIVTGDKNLLDQAGSGFVAINAREAVNSLFEPRGS